MVPRPEPQRALPGQSKTTGLTKGFTGLLQADCTGLTSKKWQALTAQPSLCNYIKTG